MALQNATGISCLASPAASGPNMSGFMMTHPSVETRATVCRRLAKAPATKDPVIAGKYLDRLGLIATREPLIRQDATALQQHLQTALGRSPGGAVAEEEEGN